MNAVINGLAGLSQGTCDDSIRLTVPRACRFVYDIASNRGGRHDPDEVDPNHMDASAVASVCAWILAELIRYAQKGAVDLGEVEKLVGPLISKKYPFREEIDGRIYVHLPKKSAVDVALVILEARYPGRVYKRELIEAIKRSGFSAANASMAVSRIRNLVDDDGSDQLWLLTPGLKKAEVLLRNAAATGSDGE